MLTRDMLIRAIGQIEGVALASKKDIRDALFCAVDILKAALKTMDEEDGK